MDDLLAFKCGAIVWSHELQAPRARRSCHAPAPPSSTARVGPLPGIVNGWPDQCRPGPEGAVPCTTTRTPCGTRVDTFTNNGTLSSHAPWSDYRPPTLSTKAPRAVGIAAKQRHGSRD